jgi:hypothetical protein
MVVILLTCGKHLHDRIISRGDVWAKQTRLTPPFFMKVSEPSQESKWSGICLLVVPIVHLIDI